MPLKFIMESMEGVEPAVAQLYTKEGENYVLTGVEGIAPKSKVDDFRTNNIILTNKLKEFGDLTPEAIKKMSQDIDDYKVRLEKSGELDDEQINKLVENRVSAMKAEHTEAMTALQNQNQGLSTQLSKVLVDNEAKTAAIEHGVSEKGLADVLLRVNSVFKVEDGKTVGYKDGEKLYNTSGTKLLGINSWVKGLQKDAPHLFKASESTNTNHQTPGFKGDASKLSPIGKIAAGIS